MIRSGVVLGCDLRPVTQGDIKLGSASGALAERTAR
jgi:hypothetical protein